MKQGTFAERVFAILLLIVSIFLVGCGQLEIEDRAFPLALSVEPAKEDGLYEFSFFFEDTGTGGSGLYHREDAVVKASGYPEAFTLFGREQAAQLDDSHMKVVLLAQELLWDREFLEAFYGYFMKDDHFSWNTMVYLTDDESAKPEELKERTGGRLGTYLLDMAESDEQERTAAVPTLGDLYKEWYNQAEVLLLPILGKSALPSVTRYRMLVQSEPGDEITMDTARLIQLLDGRLKKLQLQLEDGTVVGMEEIHLKQEYIGGRGENERWRVTVCMKCTLQNRVKVSAGERRRLMDESGRLLQEQLAQVQSFVPITGSQGQLLTPEYKIKMNWVE